MATVTIEKFRCMMCGHEYQDPVEPGEEGVGAGRTVPEEIGPLRGIPIDVEEGEDPVGGEVGQLLGILEDGGEFLFEVGPDLGLASLHGQLGGRVESVEVVGSVDPVLGDEVGRVRVEGSLVPDVLVVVLMEDDLVYRERCVTDDRHVCRPLFEGE